MKSYSYKGHTVQPKLDFTRDGYWVHGKIITHGWVVCKDGYNVMPGATWFESIREAKEALNVLLRVECDAKRFWEAMQPKRYKLGQRVTERDCTVERGGFRAVIKNHRVVSVETTSSSP